MWDIEDCMLKLIKILTTRRCRAFSSEDYADSVATGGTHEGAGIFLCIKIFKCHIDVAQAGKLNDVVFLQLQFAVRHWE
jgi:hypothetical protein